MQIHPLVRDLYKRVLIVGKDYPNNNTGTDYNHIKHVWKTAIRNPDNCPSWYGHNIDDCNSNHMSSSSTTTTFISTTATTIDKVNDMDELLHAVHRGRMMVKEMMGIIQLHKYRSMKQRYNNSTNNCSNTTEHKEILQHLQQLLVEDKK